MTKYEPGVYKRLEYAARAIGTRHGVHGTQGGWLYTKDGRPLRVQGWNAYGWRLISAQRIIPLDRDGQPLKVVSRMNVNYHAYSFRVPEIADAK